MIENHYPTRHLLKSIYSLNKQNEGSETATPTMHAHTNYGEFKSHTALTDMGISHPISASLAMVAPTNHVHITDGESLHHTAPREGNLVSVPIIYMETEPS